MSFFLRFRNPDENSMFCYLCELFFQNNLDIPQNMDIWKKTKLESKIRSFERQYGPLENF